MAFMISSFSSTLCPIIQIKDLHENVLYEQQFPSNEQADLFFTQHSRSIKGWGVLQGAVVPQHTSGIALAQDLFLPTLLHFALKIEFLALRILAGLFAAMFDLAFLALRLVTLPFKAIYMHCRPAKEEHPVSELIRGHAFEEKAMQEGIVSLYCHMPQELDSNHVQQVLVATQKVALKKLPGGIDNRFIVETLDLAAWSAEHDISYQKFIPAKILQILLQHFDDVPLESMTVMSMPENGINQFQVNITNRRYRLCCFANTTREGFQTELYAMRQAAVEGGAPTIKKVFAVEQMILTECLEGD